MVSFYAHNFTVYSIELDFGRLNRDAIVEEEKQEKKRHFNCSGNGTTAMAVLIHVVSLFHLFVKLRISRFKRVELIIVHCTSSGKKMKEKERTQTAFERVRPREKEI